MSAYTNQYLQFANNAISALSASITSTATTLNLNAGTGAIFPQLTAGQSFILSLTDAATESKKEIMLCTAISGDTLTVTRGQEGTTAQSWLAGDIAANVPTAGTMQYILQQISAMQASSPIVGSTLDLYMAMQSPSSSAHFTANKVIVAQSLMSSVSTIALYNQTVNLATIGAGGMDTGSAPINGFVAIYAIYNPVTGATSILAQNTTGSVSSGVYTGSNMPAGYTESARISVWPTNASGQLVVGYQQDQSIYLSETNVYSGTTLPAGNLSVAAAVPYDAVSCSGYWAASTSSASYMSCVVRVSSVSPYYSDGGSSQATINSAQAAFQSFYGVPLPGNLTPVIYVAPSYSGGKLDNADIVITGYKLV